jgi:chitodextrinase
VPTTSSVSDTTPPTRPSGLVAPLASGSSGINLSWTASTDNVAVTAIEWGALPGRGMQQLSPRSGDPERTTFADSGLLASTNYSYRVRAPTRGQFERVLQHGNNSDDNVPQEPSRYVQSNLRCRSPPAVVGQR